MTDPFRTNLMTNKLVHKFMDHKIMDHGELFGNQIYTFFLSPRNVSPAALKTYRDRSTWEADPLHSVEHIIAAIFSLCAQS